MDEPPEVREWMKLAVDLGKQSASEDDRSHPKVGVVAIRDGAVIGTGYRGQYGPGCHAEFGMLRDADPRAFEGAVVFTTLEPCSRRNAPKTPCAERLIGAGVSTVYVGIYDPNPWVYRAGWRRLKNSGVNLRDFVPDLRAEITGDNWEFLSQYRTGIADRGTQEFDYLQNGGHFEVVTSAGTFETRWSSHSSWGIWAVSSGQNVALASDADHFSQIDDPGALAFDNYTTAANEGQIVAFRHTNGNYLLVRILDVHARPDDEYDSVTVEWEARLRSDAITP